MLPQKVAFRDMSELKDQIGSIWMELKETLKLNIDYARLTGAEKVTTFLSVFVVILAAMLLFSFVVFFISVGLVVLLSHATGMFGACMIMAGIYLVIMLVVFALRKRIIVDPIARFVSTLFLK